MKTYISEIWMTISGSKTWYFQKQYTAYALYDDEGKHVKDFKKFWKMTKYIEKHSKLSEEKEITS